MIINVDVMIMMISNHTINDDHNDHDLDIMIYHMISDRDGHYILQYDDHPII